MTADFLRALATGLLLCGAPVMAEDEPGSDSAEATRPTHLPVLEARDLSGRPVRGMQLDGRHTLLSFYFSSCVPCIQEVPALNAYREAHPELNYLAITFDPAVDARRFVSERKLSWPVVADAGRFLRDAGVRSFPGYMLLAPDGRIVGRGAGLALNARGKDSRTRGAGEIRRSAAQGLEVAPATPLLLPSWPGFRHLHR